MKKTKSIRFENIPNVINFEKIREKTSRSSLTIVLSLFVFGILLIAIAFTALGLWVLTLAGVIVDVDGQLQLGYVILFMFLISLIIGFLTAFLSSRIPLKPINEIINKMNRLAAGDFKTRLNFKHGASLHPAIKESKAAGCKGVFYWEPECKPSQYKLGAFTEDGRPTRIMDAFKE